MGNLQEKGTNYYYTAIDFLAITGPHHPALVSPHPLLALLLV